MTYRNKLVAEIEKRRKEMQLGQISPTLIPAQLRAIDRAEDRLSDFDRDETRVTDMLRSTWPKDDLYFLGVEHDDSGRLHGRVICGFGELPERVEFAHAAVPRWTATGGAFANDFELEVSRWLGQLDIVRAIYSYPTMRQNLISKAGLRAAFGMGWELCDPCT